MFIDEITGAIVEVFDMSPNTDEINLSHLIDDQARLSSKMMNEDSEDDCIQIILLLSGLAVMASSDNYY